MKLIKIRTANGRDDVSYSNGSQQDNKLNSGGRVALRHQGATVMQSRATLSPL